MPRVLTIGTFDLLHAGHIELFRESDRHGQLHVAINNDSFVERYKGVKPIIPLVDRMSVISSIRVVQHVWTNIGDEDAKPIIEVVRPDVITIGKDWYDERAPNPEARYHAQLRVTQQWLDMKGIKIIYLPRTMDRSSSRLRGVT
jgi:cytidyltransferase-like protein